MTRLLEVEDLALSIDGRKVLNGVALSLAPGEVLGLVGPSGCGKSMTAHAIAGLAPAGAAVSGRILLEGQNLLALGDRRMSALRGAYIGMIFQEPMTALNPLRTIEAQIAEPFLIHGRASRAEARAHARRLLARVGLPPSDVSPKRYPHELSGGQRQRVVIAMALALAPPLIIADEPTTALDASTQDRILTLLKKLCAEDGIALLLITHDLAVVADLADRIAIMRAGAVVACAAAGTLFAADGAQAWPELTAARLETPSPRAGPPAPAPAPTAIDVRDLACIYRDAGGLFARPAEKIAVDGVSFEIREGDCLGLVGESGSGKSTLARALMGLEPAARGAMAVCGETIDFHQQANWRRVRQSMQIVFQDPYSSFNPRQRIVDIVAEPLHLLDAPLTKGDRRDRALAALRAVGLEAEHLDRHPDAFSGGQRQRIAIARALIVEPALVIFDEATSALDVLSRDRILRLLRELRAARGTSFLFISHDLNVVRQIADRIAVMKAGAIVETGAARDILDAPQHPYTRALVAAARRLDTALDRLRAGGV